MHVLEQLRFSSRWVTTKQNVNLAPKTPSTALRELFANATEQLAEDTFLDILVFPDARCNGVVQDVVKILALAELLDRLDLLLCKCLVFLVERLGSKCHGSVVLLLHLGISILLLVGDRE